MKTAMKEREIFIVDDDVDFAETVIDLLETYNYQSRVYNDGSLALKALDESLPGLIIVDLAMPKMGGIEFVCEVRKKFDPVELPIIVISGMGDVNILAKAFEVGANGYIHKPMTEQELLAKINMLFRVRNVHQGQIEVSGRHGQ